MILVAGAAIIRRGPDGVLRLLSARRTEPPIAAGRWEFPGGKIEAGETPEQAVHREILEELGVRIRLLEHLDGPEDGCWRLTERILFHLWLAETVDDAIPLPLEDHDELRWLAADECFDVPWIEADEPLVRLIAERLIG